MMFLALRNLVRHWTHSLLLIGLFGLTFGVFLLGNSLLRTSDRTLTTLFQTSVTGDYVLAQTTDLSMSLFGTNTPTLENYVSIPLLTQPLVLREGLAQQEEVEMVSFLLSGGVLVDIAGYRQNHPAFGVDPRTYFSVLPGITLVEGTYLQDGAPGIMITQSLAHTIQQGQGRAPVPGDPVLLTYGRDERFRIRSVPLVGIFRYPNSHETLDPLVLVDSRTLADLFSIQTRVFQDSFSTDGPLNSQDLDLLFSDDEFLAPTPEEQSGQSLADQLLSQVLSVAPEASVSGSQPQNLDAHFVLVKGPLTPSVQELATSVGAQILPWRQAAGQSALFVLLLQTVFNGGFLLFTLVVIFGTANLVVISTYRRSREIGTLRALGIDDRQVRNLFILEHLLLALFAGLLSLVASGLVVVLVNSRQLALPNTLLRTMLGGPTLHLAIDPVVGFFALGMLLFIAVASSYLPVARANRTPIIQLVRGL
ncbi:MAG: FtsX-like permease family protein [Spirochaetales bacterium]|nr:FtsX-like permease family protein [Spirochaetales bacterium]